MFSIKIVAHLELFSCLYEETNCLEILQSIYVDLLNAVHLYDDISTRIKVIYALFLFTTDKMLNSLEICIIL